MKNIRGFYRTVQPTLVLTARQAKAGKPSGLMLPVGSIVYVNHPDHALRTPLGSVHDLPIQWRDVAGTPQVGWIAGNTPLVDAPGRLAFGDGDREPMSAWDDLREQLFSRGWTVEHFCSRLKTSEAPLVRAVIRELGGAAPKGQDTKLLAAVLTRLTHVQEVQMSQDNEAGTAPAKSATKKAKSKGKVAKVAKKAKATKEKGEGRSALRSCGEALIATGTGNGKIKAFAARLQKEEQLSGKQLIELRDLVKEAAAKAREDGKDSIAAKLSSVNRLVRRLARAA